MDETEQIYFSVFTLWYTAILNSKSYGNKLNLCRHWSIILTYSKLMQRGAGNGKEDMGKWETEGRGAKGRERRRGQEEGGYYR